MNKRKLLSYFFVLSLVLGLLPLSSPIIGATTVQLGNGGLGTYNEQGYDGAIWDKLFDGATEGYGCGSTYTTSYKTATGHLTNSVTDNFIISSVAVTLYCSAFIGAYGDAQEKLYTHGTLYTGNTFSVDAGAGTVSNTFTWNTNPFTGAAWTWTEINALETGFSMKVDDISHLIACFEMVVIVTYTPGITPVTNAATDVTETTATLNGVATYGLSSGMTCGFWYNASGVTAVNVSCAGTYGYGETFSAAVAGLTSGKMYNCTAWSIGTIGYFNSTVTTTFYTDTTPPVITINYAGNISDSGGPYYRPPGETTALSGVFLNGYYTNDSYQSENFVYINLTVTDTGGMGVNKVMLHWYNQVTNTWDNTSSFTNTITTYWEYNKTGVPQGKYSFDIWANDTGSNNINLTWWNKTGPDAIVTRRYVSLGNTPLNISYLPLYFYNATYPGGAPGKADRLTHDQGSNGGVTDTGYLKNILPTDTVTYRICANFLGFWYDNDSCNLPINISNVYVHFWGFTFDEDRILQLSNTRNYLKTTGIPSYNWTITSNSNKSTVLYDLGYVIRKFELFAGNYPYSLIPGSRDFTDNNLYEFLFMYRTALTIGPSIISNRSFNSFILFNVPSNATLNSSYADSDSDTLSDWTELYVTYTNPFLSDTDNDGGSDYFEYIMGYDPNNFTSPLGGYPSTVTGLTATRVNDTIINLNWSKGSGDTVVTRKKNSYPGTPDDGTKVYNGTLEVYSDTGLIPSTHYYYRSWGWNGVAYSEINSSSVNWTTPTPPSNVVSATGGTAPVWINITWTNHSSSNNTIIRRSSTTQPILPTDGTGVYNDTLRYYNETITQPYFYTLFSWNSTSNLYSIGANVTDFYIVWVNVYNQNNGSNISNWTIFFSSPNGTNTLYLEHKKNPTFIGTSSCPQGEDILCIVNATGYRSSSVVQDITVTSIVYLNFYLPPVELPDDGTEGENYSRIYRLRVIDDISQPIADVYTEVKKYVNETGAYQFIGSFYTNGYGEGDLWLIPGANYKVFLTKTGFISVIGDPWSPDPTFWGANYPKIFQMVREPFEPQPPIISPESIHFTGELIGNSTVGFTLNLTYLDDNGYTESSVLIVTCFNYSTNLSTLVGTYSYGAVQTWVVTINNIDRNSTYICNLSLVHTYLGTQLRFYILESQTFGITPEEINDLFDFIGLVPFGISNLIQWILLIAVCYNADSRDAGKYIIILGIIFLFIGTWLGVTSPLSTLGGAVGGTGAVLLIVIGILMEWNESKRRK